ncbi:MAG TPA: hypothetical protein VNH22_02050 [Blastocatellia bacterium]|jgi:hypothetical protein|nr:hypothetical protein [Blastocatellia bacterium]
MMAEPSAKNLFRLHASALLLIAMACSCVARAQQAAPASSVAPAAPKMVISQTAYDFGNVFRGEGLGYVFLIKNEGEADLVIEEFTPG